jgi:ankyrin repeat protein
VAWKADLNAQDDNGLTPLHLAVRAADNLKSTRSVRHLLIKGARKDVKDNFGRLPIDVVN